MAKNNTKFRMHLTSFLLLSIVLITICAIWVLLSGYGVKFSHSSIVLYKKGISPQPSSFPEYNLLSTRNWQTFTSKTGDVSFKHPRFTYPKTTTDFEGNELGFDIQLVDAETGDLSRFFIFIYKIENNPYNRPPSKYFVNQNYGFDINSAEMLDINGYPALLHYSDRHVSTSILINRTTYRVTLESRPGYSFPITKPYLSEYLTLLSSFTNPLPDTSQLNVIDGNIFIIEKNESIQLTDSGYDMEPLLSPDGNKIAYFSEAETIDMTCPDASDAGCGYDKVFDILVINSDGTNKVKLTESETLIEREILGWVDNNTVLYRDGNKSIKAYSVDSNSYQTIIGPDDAVTECFNGSCQNGYYYLWSEDHRYYVIFRGGVAAERAVYIVDTQTSEATDLEESLNFVKCYVPKLNNTTLTFTCDNTYPVPDGGLQMEPLRNVTDITYDLRTKEISEKPSWELN